MHRGYSGLRVLRLVCALMVVILHVPPVGFRFLEPLCRIAVPVFFMTTGFFLADSRGELAPARVLRMLSKTLWLTLGANVLYFGFWYFSGLGEQPLIPSVRDFVRLVFYGDYYYAALWYMTALWECLLIIWLFARAGRTGWLMWWIPAGILMWLVTGRYADAFGYEPQTALFACNVFTTAMPCMMAGVLLRRYESVVHAMRRRLPLMLAVLLLLYALELKFMPLSYGGECYMLTMPLAALVFCVAMSMELVPWMRPLAWMGAALTTALYIFHGLVAHSLCPLLFGHRYVYGYGYPLEWFTLAVIGVTLLLALAWHFGVRMVRRF